MVEKKREIEKFFQKHQPSGITPKDKKKLTLEKYLETYPNWD